MARSACGVRLYGLAQSVQCPRTVTFIRQRGGRWRTAPTGASRVDDMVYNVCHRPTMLRTCAARRLRAFAAFQREMLHECHGRPCRKGDIVYEEVHISVCREGVMVLTRNLKRESALSCRVHIMTRRL